MEDELDKKIDNKIEETKEDQVISIKKELDSLEDEIIVRKQKVSFMEDFIGQCKRGMNAAQSDTSSYKSRCIADDIQKSTNNLIGLLDEDIQKIEHEWDTIYSKKDALEKEIRDIYDDRQDENSESD